MENNELKFDEANEIAKKLCEDYEEIRTFNTAYALLSAYHRGVMQGIDALSKRLQEK